VHYGQCAACWLGPQAAASCPRPAVTSPVRNKRAVNMAGSLRRKPPELAFRASAAELLISAMSELGGGRPDRFRLTSAESRHPFIE
jgi:hypothetical protein